MLTEIHLTPKIEGSTPSYRKAASLRVEHRSRFSSKPRHCILIFWVNVLAHKFG